MSKLTIARILLWAGGATSFFLSAWGVVASRGCDWRKMPDLALVLCVILPFPFFALSLRSLKWSAYLLWALFVSEWMTRALLSRPYPAISPLDALGVMYFCVALAVQFAHMLGLKEWGQ